MIMAAEWLITRPLSQTVSQAMTRGDWGIKYTQENLQFN